MSRPPPRFVSPPKFVSPRTSSSPSRFVSPRTSSRRQGSCLHGPHQDFLLAKVRISTNLITPPRFVSPRTSSGRPGSCLHGPHHDVLRQGSCLHGPHQDFLLAKVRVSTRPHHLRQGSCLHGPHQDFLLAQVRVSTNLIMPPRFVSPRISSGCSSAKVRVSTDLIRIISAKVRVSTDLIHAAKVRVSTDLIRIFFSPRFVSPRTSSRCQGSCLHGPHQDFLLAKVRVPTDLIRMFLPKVRVPTDLIRIFFSPRFVSPRTSSRRPRSCLHKPHQIAIRIQ